MKSTLISMTLIAAGATALPAMAQDDYVAAPPPDNTVVVAQPAPPRGDVIVERDHEAERVPHVLGGAGLNVFGAMGTRDSDKLGFGGRLEFVIPMRSVGLAVGASYTQYYGGPGANYSDRNVRPLLGEAGIAIAAARGFEIRPMVGIGYTWVDVSTSANTSNAQAGVATSGFDVAPGAKISFIANNIEVYTLPKYHILNNGPDFFGLEVGAGARF